jgi:hypothetical protein
MPERGGEGNDAITLRDGTPRRVRRIRGGESRDPPTLDDGHVEARVPPQQDRS